MERKNYKKLDLNDLLKILNSSAEGSREHHLAKRAIYYRMNRTTALESQRSYIARRREKETPGNKYKQIIEYLNLSETGMSQSEIAQQFGISRQAVSEGTARARTLKKEGKI